MKVLINIACFLLLTQSSIGQNTKSIEYSDEKGNKIILTNTDNIPSELLPLFISEQLNGGHFDTVLNADGQRITYTILDITKESENEYHLRVLWEKSVYIGHLHYSMSTIKKSTGLIIEEVKYLYMEL